MPQKVTQPKIFQPPKASLADGEFSNWISNLIRELDRYYRQADDLIPDRRLFAQVAKQQVGAGFVIQPDEVFIYLTSSGAVTSNASKAIRDGHEGQFMFVFNKGSFNITIKDNAGTNFQQGGADKVIPPNGAVALAWNDLVWVGT